MNTKKTTENTIIILLGTSDKEKASRGKRCIIYDPSDANNDDFLS